MHQVSFANKVTTKVLFHKQVYFPSKSSSRINFLLRACSCTRDASFADICLNFFKKTHLHKAGSRRSTILCSYTLAAKETILSTNSPSYAEHHVMQTTMLACQKSWLGKPPCWFAIDFLLVRWRKKQIVSKKHVDFVRPPPKARPVPPQARPPESKPRPVSAPVPPPKARPMMPAPKARPVQTAPARPVQPSGVGHPK